MITDILELCMLEIKENLDWYDKKLYGLKDIVPVTDPRRQKFLGRYEGLGLAMSILKKHSQMKMLLGNRKAVK